jgi:hypothetical protein
MPSASQSELLRATNAVPGVPTIHVRYRGRLGNNLFQFAAGLIVSRHTNAPLACRPVPGFPATFGFEASFDPTSPWHTSTCDHRLDLARCAAHLGSGGDVIVDGFHQLYEIYKPFKGLLKTAFSKVVTPGTYVETSREDLVVHVRLGDFFKQFFEKDNYDLGLVHSLIKQQSFRRLVVVTDSPEDPFIERLRSDFAAEVARGDRLSDFVTLMRAKRLLITPSTFSWWAAWLSEAEHIFFPRGRGSWGRIKGINLWVDDEERYVAY